jgi:membrane protease YdiL (CAAX protease family)
MSEAETGAATPQTGITARLPAAKRGHALVAWLVIGLVVAFVFYRNASGGSVLREGFDRGTLELQARYIVGVAEFFKQNKKTLLQQSSETLGGHGSYEQRLCYAVLAGELDGPEEARRQLRELPVEEGADTETADALDAIYRAAEKKPPATPPADAVARVKEKLGWFGKLAAVPPGTPDAEGRAAVLDSARRTAAVLLGALAAGLLGALVGILVLGLCIGLAAAGWLRLRFTTGSPYAGIYAETFAAWFLLFLALSYASRFVPATRSHLLVTGLFMLASLGALGWPVIRGVPWRVVRYDVGLSVGPQPAANLLAGFGAYVTALPLLAIGAIVMLALMFVAKKFGYSPATPSHPLTPFVAESGLWGRIQALLVAGVVAPIVEETMFRGVLYRHLREYTAAGGRLLSVFASAVLVSFVFAVIHPQGWLGVAPLMGLAVAFCLVREWRGSLLPAMVAHAMQNTMTVFLIVGAS